MFQDRTDAGRQLAAALEEYRGQDLVVLAIPRGGVEVGYQVARHLGADFSIVVTRKLPFPNNPEGGFGAIAEDGSRFVFREALGRLSAETVGRILEEQKAEVQRRVKVLRGDEPLPRIQGRTVILVDDGIAMGSTMRASIKLCRRQGAGEVVVAVPVAGPRQAREIAAMVDRLIVLKTPLFFQAVAQVYAHWHDVSDGEVIEVMDRWRAENKQARSTAEVMNIADSERSAVENRSHGITEHGAEPVEDGRPGS
jgi:putative phosphoribosyl transferase